MRLFPAVLFASIVLVGPPAFSQPIHDAGQDIFDRINGAIAATCAHPNDTLKQMAAHLGSGAAPVYHQVLRRRAVVAGWQRAFTLKTYGLLEVTRIQPTDASGQITAEFSLALGERLLPTLSVLATIDCRVLEGRRLAYDGNGQLESLIVLDADLATIGPGAKLNPEFPPAVAGDSASEAIRVAIVDTGINYQLPIFARALARNRHGQPLGYDYWDLDPFPFDSDPRRSPFYPMHQGTRTASVIVNEAPAAKIVPYRFPYPDVSLMADLVRDADDAGARIVAIAFSGGEGEWDAFIEAAESRPNMLIIAAAGPGGANLDVTAEPPATLTLPNIIIVTAADRRGRILEGANFGPRSVHLAMVADDVAVVDFSGRPGRAAGTGIAAARLAALAARLLARNPTWTMKELRRELFILGRTVAGEPARTRHGVIME